MYYNLMYIQKFKIPYVLKKGVKCILNHFQTVNTQTLYGNVDVESILVRVSNCELFHLNICTNRLDIKLLVFLSSKWQKVIIDVVCRTFSTSSHFNGYNNAVFLTTTEPGGLRTDSHLFIQRMCSN